MLGMTQAYTMENIVSLGLVSLTGALLEGLPTLAGVTS